MREFIFIWSIENISYSWHTAKQLIVSPKFFAGPMADTCWTLRLLPRDRDNTDYLSLYLSREEDYSRFERISFNYELSCLAADTSVLYSCFTPEDHVRFDKISAYGEDQFLNRHEIFGPKRDLYLPQDILTLRCRMWSNDGNAFKKMFGHTLLKTERILPTEAIYPQISSGTTFHLYSKLQNDALLSVSAEYYGDGIDVTVDPIGEELVKSCTLKLTLVNKPTGKKLCEHTSCFFGKPRSSAWRLPFSEKVQLEENNNSDTSGFELITELIYSTGDVSSLIQRDYRIKIPNVVSNSLDSCLPKGREDEFPSVPEELWNLYNNKSFYDVELRTENKTFYAHNFVLCARSPVFLAMLNGEMKENITKCIEIEDISADILEKFLNFLYTDAFEDIEWDSVIDLYYVSDKYQVERLKLLCCSYLLKSTDCDNFHDLLILADRHNDNIFRQKIDEFIWRNDNRFFRSSQWKKLAAEDKDMALSTMLSKYEDKECPIKSFPDAISSHPNVLDDFKSLYQGQIVNDVVIKTGSASFPAHKVILFARSSTFKNMLTRTTTDILDIEDLEDNIFSRMLLFLYTDSLEDLQWNVAVKLYHAAEVFQIKKLKLKCLRFLLENLSASNVSDLLYLAHEHCQVKLLSGVEDYIIQHDKEIFGSDEWTNFSTSNPLLANETMRAKYKRNKNL